MDHILILPVDALPYRVGKEGIAGMFAKEGGKYVDVLYAVNEYKTDMNEFQFFQAKSEFKRGGGDMYDGAYRPNASDPPP
jgi:hypothetical protein